MILKTLPLMLTATLVTATPMGETPPEAGTNTVRAPICNTNPILLSTAHAQDMAQCASRRARVRPSCGFKPTYNDQYDSSTHRDLAPELFAITYRSHRRTGSFHSDKPMISNVAADQDFGTVGHFPEKNKKSKDDLIGFGSTFLAKRTTRGRSVPTSMDNLVAKKIGSNRFGVYFKRNDDSCRGVRNGSLSGPTH
ncbi:hypothetical protein BGZ59_008827 [Podila verticillata]|nr:hypothetical protein BGZ59_008827 [Podila verticillata]